MNKYNFKILLSFLLISIFQISYITLSKAKLFFASDSELRLIQAYGIKESDFKYGNLYYPGVELDPNYEIHPFVEDYYIHDFKNKKITHFPILYAYVSAAILTYFPPESLVYFNSICILLTLLCLFHFWKIDWKLLLFAYFGTFISVISFDNSEYPLFLLLHFFGISLLLGDAINRKTYHYAFSGILMGIACWIKVESLLYVASIFVAYPFVFKFKNKVTLKKYFILGLSFSFIVVLFFVYNIINYEHFLGPAFSINEKLYGLTPRWLIALTLFLGWNKLGLVSYNPMFLLAIIYFMNRKNFNLINEERKIIFVSTLIFILAVCLTAPTDGFVSWGPRYLLLSLLPLVIIFKDYNEFQKSSFWKNKYLLRSLIAFSIICTFLGLYLIKEINKVRSEFQKDFLQSESEIKIYDSKILTMFMGLNYFIDKNYLIKTNENVNKLSLKLKDYPEHKKITYFKLDLDNQFSNIFASQELPREDIIPTLNQKFKFKQMVKRKYFVAYEYDI